MELQFAFMGVAIGLGLIGLAALHALSRHGLRLVRAATPVLLVASFALTLAVMMPGVGVEVNGATRWLAAGPIQFQPSELLKLALYRPGDTISREDVAEMVTEALPGSTWAFLDAVGYRRTAEALTLAERLLNEGSALPLLVAQLHRRLRELIVIRSHVDGGTKPSDLVRILRLQPFRAQKLTEQARTWTADQLDETLRGLLELDLLSKGIGTDGSPRSVAEDRSQLALLGWIGGSVDRAAR